MALLTVVEEAPRRPGSPHWIQPSLNVTPGRDPLGLQTITLDRIMPRLLPGILVLSQRARYFSLHAFLLNEYQRRRLPLNNNDLSSFIKLREFEYAVAVQLCPRGCGERPVGMVGKNAGGTCCRAARRRHPSSRVGREPLGRLRPLLPDANDRHWHGRAARERARRGNHAARRSRPERASARPWLTPSAARSPIPPTSASTWSEPRPFPVRRSRSWRSGLAFVGSPIIPTSRRSCAEHSSSR